MPDSRYVSGRSYIYGYLPRAVKWLLISNCAIFVIYWVGGAALQHNAVVLFSLIPAAVVSNYYVWQLFTYMFLHGSIMHILFNMLGLYFFGLPLELDWGTRRFVKYYFYCGIAAGVCVLVANLLVGAAYTPTLGASGAIFGVLVAFGVSYPNQEVLMMFLIPIKAKHLVMIYAAIELLSLWTPNTGVATMAHLGGMAFGYLYLKMRMPRLRAMPDFAARYRQWKLQRAKKKFQVYMRKHGQGPWVN